MSFIYSCIGDNSPENREHLEKLGYDISCHCVRFNTSSLFTDKDGEVHTFQEEELGECLLEIKQGKCDLINCIGNPQLFKAVSSITDDNDEDQWFTDGKEYIFCDSQDWIDMYSVLCSGGRYNYNKNGELDKFHKATLSELEAHFQRV